MAERGYRSITAGLPLPRLQHTFQIPDGEARADFDWDGRVVGEFDGLQNTLERGELVESIRPWLVTAGLLAA